MKHKILLTIMACGASLVLCPGVRAQDASPAPATTGTDAGGGEGGHHHGGHKGGGPGHGPNADKVLERLTTELSLTADQQAKIKPLLEAQQTQMQALHADTATADKDKREKFKQIHESTVSQINAVLTPDQQTKYAALQEARKSQRGEHRHGGGGGAAAPSASPAS